MSVGAAIRKYIVEKDISQVELSKKTQIAPAKLNLSLSGKRRLSFYEFEVICWALGLDVTDFLSPHPPEDVASAS